MSYPVVISYNNTNQERSFVSNLINYLNTKGIQAEADDPNQSEPDMKQELLTARWLVLILTPEAVKSPHVKSLVKAGFDCVMKGSMQGILAIAFFSKPIDLEGLPSGWSTIRIYYTGDRDADHLQAFEKLSRTLSTSKVPVRSVSSPTANWASSFSPAASRPLSGITQPASRSRSSLTPPWVVAIALFILLVFFGGFFLAGMHSFAEKSAGASVNTNNHSTPQIHESPSVTQAESTPTPNSIPNPLQLYSKITTSNETILNDSMSAQNDNQWPESGPCAFNNGEYQVSPLLGQYANCMEKNGVFKNFAYQVQMMFTTDGSAGGLIFRSDKAVSTFYRFSLNSAGTYSFLLCIPCSPLSDGVLLDKKDNVAMDVPDTLTVIALKNNIYLFVNKVLVGDVINSTLSRAGEIGVFGASETQPTEMIFKNVKVWMLTDKGTVQPSANQTPSSGKNGSQ